MVEKLNVRDVGNRGMAGEQSVTIADKLNRWEKYLPATGIVLLI